MTTQRSRVGLRSVASREPAAPAENHNLRTQQIESGLLDKASSSATRHLPPHPERTTGEEKPCGGVATTMGDPPTVRESSNNNQPTG